MEGHGGSSMPQGKVANDKTAIGGPDAGALCLRKN